MNMTHEVSKSPEETSIIVEKTKISSKNEAVSVDTSPAALRELLEKNLKWSQIIYEQNRKLNNKLLWNAIAGWFRLLIIVIPLVAGILYLPKLLRQFQASYGNLLGGAQAQPGKVSPAALEGILNILPLDQSQREQLKTILK